MSLKKKENLQLLLTPERIWLILVSEGPVSNHNSMITLQIWEMTKYVWDLFLSRILFFWSYNFFLTHYQKLALERKFDLEQ